MAKKNQLFSNYHEYAHAQLTDFEYTSKSCAVQIIIFPRP